MLKVLKVLQVIGAMSVGLLIGIWMYEMTHVNCYFSLSPAVLYERNK